MTDRARNSIVIVTAGTSVRRLCTTIEHWWKADRYYPVVAAVSGGERLPLQHQHIVTWVAAPYGVVPAFAAAMDAVRWLDTPPALVICLHDDVEILDDDWDLQILEHWVRHPQTVLAGFGGAMGLGAADIYRTPYHPMQLARQDFVSNLRDAEAHGRRSTVPERCVVFDGFCQIAPTHFMQYLWQEAAKLGLVHHAYDALFGGLIQTAPCRNLAWPQSEAWMIPVACHHRGGETAVADTAYHAWAQQQTPEGDLGFWQQSHYKVYERLRGILPLRVS